MKRVRIRFPRTKKNNFQTFWTEEDTLTVKNCKGCNLVGAKKIKILYGSTFSAKNCTNPGSVVISGNVQFFAENVN